MRRSREHQRNDNDRREWVENDEGLYRLCMTGMRMEGVSKKEWVKRNRGLIDAMVDGTLRGDRPAHTIEGRY